MIWPFRTKASAKYWLRVFLLYAVFEAGIQLLFFVTLNTFQSSRISDLQFHFIMWVFQCLFIWPIWYVAFSFRRQQLWVHDILFIEALKEYVKIVTHGKPVITYHTISGLEEKMQKRKFYRIHRSYLVNVKAIQSIEGFIVKMDKYELPISRNERDAFIEFIASGRVEKFSIRV